MTVTEAASRETMILGSSRCFLGVGNRERGNLRADGSAEK